VGYAKVQAYRVSLSQILTKNSLLGFTFDTITDEGFLNNPYRSVRYRDGPIPGKWAMCRRGASAGPSRLPIACTARPRRTSTAICSPIRTRRTSSPATRNWPPSYDMFNFDYEDFRNIPAGGPVGEEPLYSFDAGVIRAFLSIWY